MTYRAGSRYPSVILASPVGQPSSVRHSARSSGPAARWIAPSTPPPPSSEVFAALTIASTSKAVISATRMSRQRLSMLARRIGSGDVMTVTSVMPGPVPGIHVFDHSMKDVDGRDKPSHDVRAWSLRPLRVRPGAQVEGAAPADIGEMFVEEAARRALAAGA